MYKFTFKFVTGRKCDFCNTSKCTDSKCYFKIKLNFNLKELFKLLESNNIPSMGTAASNMNYCICAFVDGEGEAICV